MAAILEFIPRSAVFDDEALRVMTEAFEAACAGIQDQREIVREIIARRIIEAAKKGERDPIVLRDAGLVSLGYDKQTGR
jgi:hypothetical protein